jgi:hypothetical protein
MACGCMVAGFHGDGGREYMIPKNGWWADMGDYKGCTDGLCAAVEVLTTPGPGSILPRGEGGDGRAVYRRGSNLHYSNFGSANSGNSIL